MLKLVGMLMDKDVQVVRYSNARDRVLASLMLNLVLNK
jgi:hypothetical protein